VLQGIFNPLRAKLVGWMAELYHYEFCGHEVILGKHQNNWQYIDKLLGMFGKRVDEARRNYRAYVEQGIEIGRRAGLIGCSRGKNCARVESGAFFLTKH
jgi:hypothetical protein